MAEKPKYYITTPIYYVNARPHLGHTYTTIAADAIARYKQMRGYNAVFLTGTDEHGQKVERSAKKEGVAPQDFADRISNEYRALWKELDLRVDRFIRTTELRHARAVQKLFREVQRNGYVEKGYYEGNYCVYDELYVEDPTPGANCPDCGRPTERVKEENYFFKLSAFEKPLLNYYEKHPEFVQPDARRNEVISFVSGGLRDLSISRTTLKWGIPWPGDEKHVFYVWSDALTNYITAVGYADNPAEFERLWPADVHLVGKEIIRFHAVYWPAFLMAAGLPLPKQVFAHGHILFQEEKMSKSRGNVQLPQPIARVLGTDALRYFLLREIVFGQDGNFSREALVARYNSDLANGLGNFASRTLTMLQRFCNGSIPVPSHPQDAHTMNLTSTVQVAIGEALTHYDRFQFNRALEFIWDLISSADNYLTAKEPWKIAEETHLPEKQRELNNVLYTAADVLRVVSALAHPVLPAATAKIWSQLGQRGTPGEVELDRLREHALSPGAPIGKLEAIFPRVEKEEAIERIEAMEHELQQPKAAAAGAGAGAGAGGGTTPAPATTDRIAIEDFAKVEMRVGEIKTAERVQGADKLLKITVDIGSEVRQVVAGIAQHYEPEKLVGRKVIVVVNLQPRKLRGVESNGMIVAASVGPEGRPVLAGFHEDVEIGARLK
jgi:methionyl-tRNA synthetase